MMENVLANWPLLIILVSLILLVSLGIMIMRALYQTLDGVYVLIRSLGDTHTTIGTYLAHELEKEEEQRTRVEELMQRRDEREKLLHQQTQALFEERMRDDPQFREELAQNIVEVATGVLPVVKVAQ